MRDQSDADRIIGAGDIGGIRFFTEISTFT
jgi:hypothetical protein